MTGRDILALYDIGTMRLPVPKEPTTRKDLHDPLASNRRVCAVVLLAGCKQEPPKPKAGDAWEVNWPGGSVKIDPEKGVDVKAPGVDVNYDKDRGVKVKTPRTDVNVDKDRGVEVKTPGADVQVK